MSGSMWVNEHRWRVGKDDYLIIGARARRFKRPWAALPPRGSSRREKYFYTQPEAMRYAVRMARRDAR